MEPQPKWAILQALNYVVLGTFVASFSYVMVHYRNNTEDSISSMFVPIIILWSICLAYFFGFFGISFVDKDAMTLSPSSVHPSTDDLTTLPSSASASSSSMSLSYTRSAPVSKAVTSHVPPICSDNNQQSNKVSFAASTLSSEEDFNSLSDEEILSHLISGSLKDYQLETKLEDRTRAVHLRRQLFENVLQKSLTAVPYLNYDYDKVFGANCEIVVGYVPLPIGLVGPLSVNGEDIFVPMATTEGCLVASTNRGCKAITASGGCSAILLKDAITRAPCLRFPTAARAAALKHWVEVPANYRLIEEAFNGTTNYGKLVSVEATVAGRNAYLRFCCMSGDAMGMNMVSKGCLAAIEVLEGIFPDLDLVAISGNMCTDKKPAAINWILGRGKSIVVEAIIPDSIVKSVLKSTVADMIDTNKHKNLIGSAMAGSIGGFNAHAANVLTAVFLATGQDPAQNVESSNCITQMDFAEDGESLHVSVTMPSVEVGTVGGGTHLPAQSACLDICGVRGAARVTAANPDAQPGDNARKLALIIGSAVLAGELSLMAALAANHLVRSHMQHNRKTTPSVADASSSEDSSSRSGKVSSLNHSMSLPNFSASVTHNAAAKASN